ncbi:MAG: AAA family ATPase, partial [Nannocystaceae bacterium]
MSVLAIVGLSATSYGAPAPESVADEQPTAGSTTGPASSTGEPTTADSEDSNDTEFETEGGTEAVPPEEQAVQEPIDPVSAVLVSRAEAMEALLEGRLSLDVDAQALFVLELDAPYAHAWLAALVEAPTDAAGGKSRAQSRFATAWKRFFALDAVQRQMLLQAHTEARAEVGFKPQDLRSLRAQLETTQAEIDTLRRFIAGTLAPEVDITPVLHIDLEAPTPLLEMTLEQAKGYTAVVGRPLVEELAVARAVLAFLRLHYAGLNTDEKKRLHGLHLAARMPDGEATQPPEAPSPEDAELSADEVAQAREQALRAAAEASTEELRRIEEARASLLGLQAEVSQVEASLGRSREQRVTDRKAVATLATAAEEIENLSPLDGDPAPAAGALLTRARDLHEQACDAFAADLDAANNADSDLPDIASALAQLDPVLFEDPRLAALRAELRRRAEVVRDRETADRWQRLRERQADVAAINKVRQNMLRLAPSAQRDALNSFGSTGLAEAGREINHLSLDLRYWMRALPRRARNIGSEVLGSPVAVAKGALTFLLALFVFIAWRRRAPRFVEGMAVWSKTAPMTLTKRIFGPALRYAPYVRLSLEWMALAYLLLQVLGHRAQIPGVDMLWQITAWILGGIAVIRLLHAMASESRYRRRGDPTAELRLNSLRLVGLCATTVGLFLSVTATTVGRGTIFAWMVSTCWILAFPIALLLTTWWRPVVRKRLAEAGHDTGVARWVLRTDEGLRGFVAAGVGGVYLLITGTKRFVVRRASRFEVTRRILAYLVRREVAKQANRDDGQLTDIDPSAAAKLDPSFATPEEAFVTGPCAQALEDLQGQQLADRVTVSAVIGEAGSGKSTVVEHLVQKTSQSIVVQCAFGGFDALLGQLARGLGLSQGDPDTRESDVLASLAQSVRLVVIDDAHHLVRPVVGGLGELDRLLAFARKSSPGTSWVLVLGDPAWQYIYRARAQGAAFDTMVELPRWDEEQIGELLRRRSKAAGLKPTFEGLDVPRQATDDDDLSEHERREQGYYRILWDYVDGNPAVALHWWQRSLFADQNGNVVVRLFHPPRFTALDALPPSVYFTLRALVQLDGALRGDIIASTQLAASEIDDTLRFASARGFIELRGDRIYLTRDWFRAVTRVL